jgi:chromosome segregation ATPase
MSTQVNASRYETESVIPFAANTKTVPANELDKAGQTILQLLHRAAGVAETNSRQALEMAQKLSHQLRSAEDRIAELEAEAESNRERAERAEQWLHTVYAEIENRFLRNTNSTPTTTSRDATGLSAKIVGKESLLGGQQIGALAGSPPIRSISLKR